MWYIYSTYSISAPVSVYMGPGLCMSVPYVHVCVCVCVHLRIYICFLCTSPAEGYALTEVYSLCVRMCVQSYMLGNVCICRMGIQLL